MYEYIIGSIAGADEDRLIVECKEIGYSILVSSQTLAKLTKDKEKVKIYIHQHIREDEMTLYGFWSKEERKLFRDLISVSGVGPKVSLGVLSTFSMDQFIQHISSSDEKAISSAPGIGKKTANRLILELKDKYKNFNFTSDVSMPSNPFMTDKLKEASEALESLGFPYTEALAMVNKVFDENKPIEDLIKMALKASKFGNK
ncbi:Holliday junction branch migration protein RuvA [Alkalibacter mobilis]|uniref:Holliday junction branch migration protein RuvA n=1 Tax=Alkalibacter mobilis TaxID=2787712 RepID=UPI00189E4648|nr:Holliday junction branch migration protein RuvA [Alkalibacter mobilis]MBF7095896.1 Holliday junction branch migration protein RuvA [Alkalibacter mobilis]